MNQKITQIINSCSKKENILTLGTKDNEVFSVKESVALQCCTIKNKVEEGCINGKIPLPNVDGKILALILEYLNEHADSSTSDNNKDHKDEFDSKFFDRQFKELLEILSAAIYLGINCLMSSTSIVLANLMKEMSVEEAREMFNVENDYTLEEEAEQRKEVAWAFE